MRVILLSVNQLPQPWIHAQGNPSLQLKQGMAHISGRFQIPFISRSSATSTVHSRRIWTYSRSGSSSITT
uniref:Transcription activator protein n=1 Tax=Cotton leaf curl Kokhran virus TaxID=222464 RepID=A0A898BLK1_9GEMI|nr:transcription activator protein [Cotton leaf curl Kokhran virus]